MYDMTFLGSLSGEEVSASHSHCGFSPVILAAKPSRGTVSTLKRFTGFYRAQRT
jgi:hypothetical protein